MTTYVDNLYTSEIGRFGRMRMSHMIADSHDELVAMAEAIGVQTKWIQHAGTAREHFDIAMSKRDLAIARGAVPIEARVCSAMVFRRQVEGTLGAPGDAIDWRWAYRLAKSKGPANMAV